MINHYNQIFNEFFFLELDLSKHINIYALFCLVISGESVSKHWLQNYSLTAVYWNGLILTWEI
jgi:hypothetical protein